MAADFISGFNGGVAGVLVGHPFDTIKIRLQTQNSLNPRYTGALHCFSSIIRQESPVGLFKGMATPIITIAGLTSVIFGTFGFCLRRLDEGKLSSHVLAGFGAGTVQSFLICPIELSKIKIQVQGIGVKKSNLNKQKYAGSVDALLKILKSEGISGCYRGLGMTLIRDVPGYGIYFFVFEGVCRMFLPYTPPGESLGVVPLLVAGGLSGVANWFCVYPFDVLKSRFQSDGTHKYSSYVDLVKKSYSQEGFRVFSRGLGITLVRAFPTCAAIFTSATLTKRLLHRSSQRDSHF